MSESRIANVEPRKRQGDIVVGSLGVIRGREMVNFCLSARCLALLVVKQSDLI